MKQITPLLLIALACPVLAQPVIMFENGHPIPGDLFTYHVSMEYELQPAGEEGTAWDLSAFSGITEATSESVEPPFNAPEGTTVSEVAGADAYFHYSTTVEGYQFIGFSAPMGSYICSDPQMIIPYPFTMGSEIEDTFFCEGQIQNNAYTRAGQANIIGASWGTLMLPYGNFDNVLMLQTTLQMTENMENDPTVYEYSSVIQQFLKPGLRTPLFFGLNAVSTPGSANFNGYMLDEALVGVEEAMRNTIGIDLMPNPATTQLEVAFGTSASGSILIEVFGPGGQVVLQRRWSSVNSGIQRKVIDVSSLASGLYSVRITDEKGASGVKRLVVN